MICNMYKYAFEELTYKYLYKILERLNYVLLFNLLVAGNVFFRSLALLRTFLNFTAAFVFGKHRPRERSKRVKFKSKHLHADNPQ